MEEYALRAPLDTVKVTPSDLIRGTPYLQIRGNCCTLLDHSNLTLLRKFFNCHSSTPPFSESQLQLATIP